MSDRLLHLVDKDQAQFAGFQVIDSCVNSKELSADFLDISRSLCFFQALSQQFQYFAVGPTTLAFVLIITLPRQMRHQVFVSVAEYLRRVDHQHR